MRCLIKTSFIPRRIKRSERVGIQWSILLGMPLIALIHLPYSWAASSADYEPYIPPTNPTESASLFVILAYSTIWLVLLFFVLTVWRRQKKVEAELRALHERLSSKEANKKGGINP